LRTVTAPLVVLLMFVLAACGGSAPASGAASDAPSAPATASPAAPTAEPSGEPAGTASSAALDALKAAARASVDTGSVSIVYDLGFDGSTLIPDGTFMSGTGKSSFGDPLRMSMDADFVADEIGHLEMIVDDRLVYMRGDILAQLVPAEMWLEINLDSTHPAAASFTELVSGQNDTSLGLYYLYGATGNVVISDGEAIDGAPTTRYEVELDLDAAREQVPENVLDVLDGNIAEMRAQGVAPQFDGVAWANGDGHIVRASYTFDLGPTQGGGNMIATYDFGDYGAPLELGIPPDADVVSIEELVPGPS
jgi:hypothetical protein